MDLVSFQYDTKSSLPNSSIENGRLHAVWDNGELHLDYGGKRIQLSDIEVHNTEQERQALLAPKLKFHYCKDSGNLWYKNGVWKLVGQQGVTKTEIVQIGSELTMQSSTSLESGWIIKRITIVNDGSLDGTISITVGSDSPQTLLDADVFDITGDEQFDSMKIIKLTTSGPIIVTRTGTSGSGTLYIEYTIT